MPADAGVDGSAGNAGDTYEPPPPVAIDETGLIATSGKQLLLIRSSPPRSSDTITDVLALDLETSELHELATGLKMQREHPSPDSRTFMYSVYTGPEGSGESELFMARMLDDGVVPSRAMKAVVGRAGQLSEPAWIDDGRFAVLSHHSATRDHRLQVIDVHAGVVYASVDDGSYVSAAPARGWFSYGFRKDEAAHIDAARVTADGLETVEGIAIDDPAAGVLRTVFSDDGTRVLFETFDASTYERAYFYRDLPAGKLVPIEASPDDEEVLKDIHRFVSDRDHVIASYRSADGGNSIRRLSLATGESTSLTDDYEATFGGVVESRDEQLEFFVARNSEGRGIELVDLTDISPPIATAFGTSDFGAAGAHHIYYVGGFAGLSVLGRDDAGDLHELNMTGVERLECLDELQERFVQAVQPSNRFTFLGSDNRLHMIDLDKPKAVDAGSIQSKHSSARLECPIWNAEGTAFAYAEQQILEGDFDHDGDFDLKLHSWIWLVRWPKDGSRSKPELVFEADEALTVVLAQP